MMDKVNIFNSSDELILSVYPDDTSYRYKAIMGENSLTLKFSLETFVEFEIDSYIDYKAERYFLWDAGNIVKENTRNFDYTLQLQTYAALLGTKQFKFFTVDGLGNPIPPYKIKGSYSGTPQDFLTLIVRNMNDGDSGWTVGNYIVGEAKLMSFNQLTCSEFLTQVANEYKTEWEIVGKTISLGKVEKDKESPVPLSYGFGNGFKSGVKRKNGDTSQINRLLVQGGSTNIDKSKYRIYNMVGSDILLLPANATKIYNGVTYETDAFGTYVQRSGLTGRIREGSYENVDIYPQRVGTVSSVVTVDADQHLYDIVDSSIPEALDYNAAMIDGEVRTIIFQTGALSGQEFDIQNYYHAADDTHAARTFEIVPKEDAGVPLPSGTLIPAVGDKYIIYHISMPQTYIDTAEQEFFDKSVEVLYENELGTFTFTGELDGIYAKTNWLTIGAKLNCGYFVSFTDAQFQTDPVLIRIVGVREYLNKPYEPVLELTNNVQAKTLASTLRDRDADEVRIDNSYINSLAYTKRRWRDAKETMKLLQDAFDNFGAGINPIWVQTMSLLVGDESLQYRFVNFIPLVSTDPEPITVNDTFIYNNGTKTFSNQIGHIQHMTIGITSISPSHSKLEYKYWNIPAFSYVFTDTDAYYVYLKCSKTTDVGAVLLSKTAYKLDPNDGYYYFLVGTLSSEVEGERSFVTLYGFTEILPGRITVDKILSPDGIQYWDMLANKFKIGNETKYLSYNENNDNILKLVGTIEATDGHIAGWSILTDSIKKGNVVLGADGSISSVSGATTFWTLNADGSGSVGSGGLSWDTQGNIIGNFVELYNNGDFNVAGNIFATGSIVAGATNGIAPDDLPVATSSLYGVVKFDAATLGLNGSGQLTVIGGGWSNVSWGTPTSQYTPLTVDAVTRNLSVDGHTHSYFLDLDLKNIQGGDSNHRLELGYSGRDYVNWYEYGGLWKFIQRNNEFDTELFQINTTNILYRGNTIWHAGNDGAGSGLDADLIDGINSNNIVYGTNGYACNNIINADFNTINKSGLYTIYGGANSPTGSNQDKTYSLLSILEGSLTGSQLAYSFYGSDSGNLYVRGALGGSFSAWRKIWHEGNDGAGSGLDADLLDGFHLNTDGSTGVPWGFIPLVKVDGVMEIGRYIDFHNTSPGGIDYTTRLTAAIGSHQNEVYLPVSAGMLALTTDNVASATKLANTRTIWGQNFNGEGDVSGSITGATTGTFSSSISATTGIFSNLTANYLPKHTISGLINSSIFDDGSIVSINPTGAIVRLNGGDRYLDIDGYTNDRITIYGETGYDIEIKSNYNANQLYLKSNGNVGIGTSDPQYKLDVNGNGRFSGTVSVNSISLPANANIQFGTSWNTGVLSLLNGVTTAIIIDVPGGKIQNNLGKYLIASSSVGQFGTQDNYGLSLVTNNTEKLRIDTNGNVGIGITAPQTKLDVNGAGRFTETLSASRVIAGYDSGYAGSVSCSNWFRSNGETGWYNDTFGAGIKSDTANVVRTYSTNKFKVYNTAIDSILTLGGVTAANVVSSGAVVAGALNGALPNDLPVATSAVFGVVKTGASINNNAGVVNLNGRHYTTVSTYTDAAVREITAEIPIGTGTLLHTEAMSLQLPFLPSATTKGVTGNILINPTTWAGTGLNVTFLNNGTNYVAFITNYSGSTITKDGIKITVMAKQTI